MARRRARLPHSAGPDRSRRRLLLGGGAVLLGGPALLAACADSDTTTATPDTGAGSGDSGPLLIGIFDNNSYLISGIEQRLPLVLGDPDGAINPEPPAELAFQVATGDGEPIGDPIVVARHGEGVETPYFPLRTTFDEAGPYEVTVVDGEASQKQVFAVNDPRASSLVWPGQPLPAVATPTPTDPRGVDPICTRLAGPCDLHTPTLAEALEAGRPIALQVSTPEFCQIAVCGPVLELMLEEVPRHPEITFLHAEVYADAQEVGLQRAQPTEIVTALSQAFEPSMLVADASGTVVDRLDFVFDQTEIAELLAKVA